MSLGSFAAFHFDLEAARNADEAKWPGITLLKAEIDDEVIEPYRGNRVAAVRVEREPARGR